VPVVVVFTKFDDIVRTAKYDLDADDPTDTQPALDAAHEQYKELCRSLFGKDPGDLPAVNISGVPFSRVLGQNSSDSFTSIKVDPEYSDLIEQLIKVTDKSITDSRIASMRLEMEQMGSQGLEVDTSIECVASARPCISASHAEL
jgi:hypothetical protein